MYSRSGEDKIARRIEGQIEDSHNTQTQKTEGTAPARPLAHEADGDMLLCALAQNNLTQTIELWIQRSSH